MADFFKRHWLALLLIGVLLYTLYQLFKTVQAGISAAAQAAGSVGAAFAPFQMAGAFISWIGRIATGSPADGDFVGGGGGTSGTGADGSF